MLNSISLESLWFLTSYPSFISFRVNKSSVFVLFGFLSKRGSPNSTLTQIALILPQPPEGWDNKCFSNHNQVVSDFSYWPFSVQISVFIVQYSHGKSLRCWVFPTGEYCDLPYFSSPALVTYPDQPILIALLYPVYLQVVITFKSLTYLFSKLPRQIDPWALKLYNFPSLEIFEFISVVRYLSRSLSVVSLKLALTFWLESVAFLSLGPMSLWWMLYSLFITRPSSWYLLPTCEELIAPLWNEQKGSILRDFIYNYFYRAVRVRFLGRKKC